MLLQQQHLITALKSELLAVPLRTPQSSGCTLSSQLIPQTQVLPEKRECSPHAESGTSRSPERGRQGKNPLSSPVIHRVWRLLSSVAQQLRQTPEIPCLMLSGFGTSAGPLIPTLEPSFQGSRDSHAQQCQSSSHLPEHCCFSTFQWLMEWLSTTRGAGRWGGRGEDTRSS